MDCTECNKPVEETVYVTYATGETEEMPLCAECQSDYLNGSYVSAIADSLPDSGGEPRHFARCTDCGEVYPAQSSEGEGLRPIGVENGTCECGNSQFQPLVEN